MASMAELNHPALHAEAARRERPCRRPLDTDWLAAQRIVGFDPTSDQFPPYLMLRSELLNHVQATQMRVFAVTSVQPGNGKTHVAVNLAAALSRLRPTALIDLDLRRPQVGARLGLESGPDPTLPGIDDVLTGEADLADAMVQVQDFELSVCKARRPRGNAEALLGSSRLDQVISTLRADTRNLLCIIDTPPVLAHDDLMLIARCVDGVLMVVEEARTTKRSLKEAARALSPTPIVGSVLNMSLSSVGGRRDYGYEYRTATPGPPR